MLLAALVYLHVQRLPTMTDHAQRLPMLTDYANSHDRLRGGGNHEWQRAIGLSTVTTAAVGGYLGGSRLLDATLVRTLGIDRSGSAHAFGPFVTLLGLVYSVILAQIYTYLFDRQSAIQEALFDEVSALRTLKGCVDVIATTGSPQAAAHATTLLGVLRAHATHLLRFDGAIREEDRTAEPLVMLLSRLETAESESRRRVPSSHPTALLGIAAHSVSRVALARSRRFAAISAELPRVQTLTARLIASVLLFGFVLVDLGAPKLEALLFGILAAAFFLISSFLSDLADPFGGSWSVEDARGEVRALHASLAHAT